MTTTTTTRRLVVTVSGPARELHPNWRGHWGPKAREVKAARFEAWRETIVALQAGRRASGSKAAVTSVTIKRTFYVPDRRARDVDGLEHSTKAHADGIADALGVNDRLFRWLPSEVIVERGRRAVQFEIEVEG